MTSSPPSEADSDDQPPSSDEGGPDLPPETQFGLHELNVRLRELHAQLPQGLLVLDDLLQHSALPSSPQRAQLQAVCETQRQLLRVLESVLGPSSNRALPSERPPPSEMLPLSLPPSFGSSFSPYPPPPPATIGAAVSMPEGSRPPSSPLWSSSDGTPVPTFSFDSQGATVLVVDDAGDGRRFVAHVLKKRYRVIAACDGVEGLERAREARPDLIVSDVVMPRMDGIEFCRQIRADAELSRTPVILLSANDNIARKIEGLTHGADDYLSKPFNANELLTKARNLIRIHYQERELMNALRALEERERIVSDDLRQAREFQQSILPPPPRVPGLTADVLYQPVGPVGGDIYDIQSLDEHRLRFFLADATGHGVQASLTTMLIKSEYEFAKQGDADPAQVLARLNDRIASTYASLGMRFTAACVEVDKKLRRVRYSAGAHPAPLLLHHGYARELPASGPFLGLMAGVEFPLHEEAFGPGDRVYLYTDGITEEWNGPGEAFGEDRLFRALEEVADQGALAGAFIYDQVCRFIEGGREQYDDMTLLGVWWGQPPGYDKEKQ